MIKKISVVIPVYNVEKYLMECLNSVINQTYTNLQIILIDDGSTDSSGKICDEYANKDNRIIVVHQDNQGAGVAKNVGLELIDGEYLSIIDSDDYIEINMYETMVSYIEKYNADVVQCLFCNMFVNNRYKRRYNFKSDNFRILKSSKYLFEMLYDWKYCVFWNKLFKTSLLSDIRFPEGRKIDDEFFTYKLICKAEKIVNINDCLYNYRMRATSVMNDSDEIKLLMDRIDCLVERYNYISKYNTKLKKYFYNHLSEFLTYYKNISNSQELIEVLENALRVYPAKKVNILNKMLTRVKKRNLYPEKNVYSKENEEYFI